MNAETFNRLHPIGTPVVAYPGARPEDIPSARRIVTRTRSKAQPFGLDREGVVWVDGHGACIALTHVDVVAEAEYEAAQLAVVVASEGNPPLSTAREAELLAENERLRRENASLRARVARDDVEFREARVELDGLRAEQVTEWGVRAGGCVTRHIDEATAWASVRQLRTAGTYAVVATRTVHHSAWTETTS